MMQPSNTQAKIIDRIRGNFWWIAVLWAAATPCIAATGDTLNTAVRVRTAPASLVSVGQSHQATAVVAAYRKATVAAEVAGRIVARLVEPGVQAKANQILVRIDAERSSLALRQAQALAQARRVDLEHAQHEYQRGQRLFKRNVISQDRLDDLRFAQRAARAQLEASEVEVASAQRNVDDSEVKAPFAGQVEQVHVQTGDYVNPGQPITTHTDFTRARLVAGVTGREANSLNQGATARVLFEDLGGALINAKITSIGSIRDGTNGTFPVELLVDDPQTGRLREGMIAKVMWHHEATSAETLSIPSSAIIRRGGNIQVFVVDNGRARLREVRVGQSDGQRIEVLQGVSIGERVVIEGMFALREGASVAAEP